MSGYFRADLALVGFGNVARRFALLLEDRRELLMREYALDCRIVGVATRRHGGRYDPRGVDVAELDGSGSSTGGTASAAMTPRGHADDSTFKVVLTHQQLATVLEEQSKPSRDISEPDEREVGAQAAVHAMSSRTFPTSSSAEVTYAG